jgi:NitT/TauT family transport system substrate-binding protein
MQWHRTALVPPRLLAAILGLLVLGIGLSSCSGGKEEDAPEQVTEAKSEPLQVAIIAWVGYSPLELAEAKGFFDKRGLDVEFQKIEDSGARRMALAAGRVDVSIAILDELAASAANGLDVRAFLKVDDSFGGDGLVAREEITSAADLKGKSIAFPQGLPSHYLLYHVLKDAGLSLADIEPRYMEAGEAGAAFIAGRVDAAVTWEPWLTRASETSGCKVLMSTKDRPGLIVDLLVATPQAAENRSDDLRKLTEGWFEALEYIQSNPDDANAIMARELGVETTEFEKMVQGVKHTDLAGNREYFMTTGEAAPVIQRDLATASTVWIDAGVSEGPIDPTALYTDQVVRSFDN